MGEAHACKKTIKKLILIIKGGEERTDLIFDILYSHHYCFHLSIINILQVLAC